MIQDMEKGKAKKNKIMVKRPTQERSRQTVATILEACARLLISEGFYSLTTDKIAKEAKVSIGSLYQFFGNKESVVQAVVKNLLEEDKRIVAEQMKAISPLPAEQRVRAMLNLAFEVCRRNSDLRAKLTTVQYYVADASYISESIRYFQEIVRANLPEIPGRDLGKVAYVVVNAFIGMVNNMSIDKADYINDPSIVAEMSILIQKYLDLNPVAAAGSPSRSDYI